MLNVNPYLNRVWDNLSIAFSNVINAQGWFEDALVSKKKLYSSLSLSKETSTAQTRLITLLPGTFDDLVQCTLHVISLDSSVEYEALSYVWGETIHKDFILVNNCRFEVTVNLHDALRRLRHEQEPRVLWIDAICIDQDSMEERNHQVRSMTTIYRSAKTVLIWLGACEYARALLVLDLISTGYGVPVGQRSLLDSGLSETSTKAFRFGNEMSVVLTSIMQRDWFHRIWTKQELVVASQDPTVMIGSYCLPWTTFCDAVQKLMIGHHFRTGMWGFGGDRSELDRLFEYNEMRKSFNDGRSSSLYFLLYYTRHAQATDPRDRVNALLGLSTRPTLEEFSPDYSLSIEELCKRTAVSLIKAENNLRPLLRWSSRSRKLPSWVPDYTASLIHFAQTPLVEPTDEKLYSASGNRKTPVFYFTPDLNGIILRGLFFDTVETVRRSWYKLDDRHLKRQKQKRFERNDVRQYLDKSEPFSRTLVGDIDVVVNLKMRMKHGYDYSHHDMIQRLYGEGTHCNSADWGQITKRCVSVMKARCVFTTSTGFVGIGPKWHDESSGSTARGDVVAILYGSEVPFILRPQQNSYEMIGECYVAGIMDGEYVQLCEQFRGEPDCPKEQDFLIR